MSSYLGEDRSRHYEFIFGVHTSIRGAGWNPEEHRDQRLGSEHCLRMGLLVNYDTTDWLCHVATRLDFLRSVSILHWRGALGDHSEYYLLYLS